MQISENQNTALSTIFGKTHFKEVAKVKKNTCQKCILYHEECSTVPCTPDIRKDGKQGIFTIQQIPEIKDEKNLDKTTDRTS